MAEGYEFDNPVFEDHDEDDYDNEIGDEFSITNDQEFHKAMTSQYEALDNLRGEDYDDHLMKLIKLLVKRFYERNQEPTWFDENEVEWIIKDDKYGRPLLGIESGGKDYHLSYYKSNKPDAILQFHSFDTIQRKYGVKFIRDDLGVTNYKPSATRLDVGRKEFQSLINTRNEINTATQEIPLQDLSKTADVQDTIDATNVVETSLANWLDMPDVANVQTQTEGLTFRELQGLDKAVQRYRGELTNNLAKLTDIDKDIAKEKRKLGEAEDEEAINDINARLKNLEDERNVRLEAASANKEALRSQINRIKETINKVLKEDTTLGERLRTLFREQGITIVSILTAIGMIIGVIVEAVIPTGGSGSTPKPQSKGGVKEWIKQQLHNLGRLLASLAGKAAAALPGIIGSIVSWLLSATGKVVNWFGNNLWAVVVAVAGLLYVAAKEWIVH
ncbi:MAG: hypothetical protein KZQ68_17070 [gamma proteobacterium symbiont of Bathyaustriella thionipta]|nr:hypothetical protein [gamma proteobacterium symbiont of Bathyaustriella thionipta]